MKSLCPLVGILVLALSSSGAAQTETPAPEPTPPPVSKDLDWMAGGQANFIGQHIFPFHSPYSGPNSLQSENITDISMLYTGFFGARLTKGVEFYADPELAGGKGLSDGFGTAGIVNGDVIRNPTLGGKIYPARVFFRFTWGTGKGVEKIERQASANQIGGVLPSDRLILTFGKFSMADVFDTNRYANSSRSQFFNWSFINNLAWDYPADTRGYTEAATLEWKHPDWALRVGVGLMPLVANGPDLDFDIGTDNGQMAELELHPRLPGESDPLVVRVLAYRNFANMGNYQQAVELAAETGGVPMIASTARPGTVKYGFGLNLEQPLANDGDTGLFARAGWSDGKTESFAYAECDATLTVGAQISGANWGQAHDKIGFALAQNVIFAPHQEYLAKGGLGFQLGDGALDYGPERTVEAYYSWQMTKAASLTGDLQWIHNPGYNQARGPVVVPGLRFHIEY